MVGMNTLKHIFNGLFIAAFAAQSAFAVPDCNNKIYRQTYPERCKTFQQNKNNNTFLSVIGGAALVGVGVAMAAQKSGNNGSSSQISNQNSFSRLTLSSNVNVNYNQNETIKNQRISSYYMQTTQNNQNIDNSLVQNIRLSDKYQQNIKRYDSINFAVSQSRGFSGKNVNINIIDDFYSNHGNVVKDIVKNIATDANINTYNIASGTQTLNSYDYIANTINTSKNALVYNASWQIPASENQNAGNVIYNPESIKTYANAQQYLYSITSENFITQLRNTAIDNDAIFVWAAGNESFTESGALSAIPVAFPELQGHFVNVVAIDANTNKIAWYSNQCGITQNYCIAAPGSGWNTDSSDYSSGTSFAAPVVSAAIATIKEAFPYMNASEISQLLFVTAKDMGTPGIDEVYGWGLLDMDKATQPVGTPKIILSDDTIQPLNISSVSGIGASALKNANIQIAFVDDFGRAFTTNLSDKINVIPYGRGFDKLQEQEFDSIDLIGGFEYGVKQTNLLKSSGLVSAKSNKLTNFVGYKNEFNIDNVHFYQNVRLGITSPEKDTNSIISGFSNIYTTSMKMGAKWQDLSLEFAIPDMIVRGNMFLDIPVGRDINGKIIYNNTSVNLTTKPSTEYTVKYKHFSATYVNNPDNKNEIFVMAKGRITF